MGFWSVAAPVVGSLISSAAGLIGGNKAADSQADANHANAELQREFAQNGIQWKVKDAKKAGIHPLFAMGAQTTAASPSYVGDTGVANAMSGVGQDISRAVDATRNRSDRVGARMEALQLERGELENSLLRSQIAKLNQSGPAMPGGARPIVDGQGDARKGMISPVPLEPVYSEPGNPAKEVGKVTDYGYAQTDSGMAIVPSKDVKERIEDNLVAEGLWAMRNLHVTPPSRAPDPKNFPLPKGHRWFWNPFKQEFQSRPASKQRDYYDITKW